MKERLFYAIAFNISEVWRRLGFWVFFQDFFLGLQLLVQRRVGVYLYSTIVSQYDESISTAHHLGTREKIIIIRDRICREWTDGGK